jgi:hypothetical protein
MKADYVVPPGRLISSVAEKQSRTMHNLLLRLLHLLTLLRAQQGWSGPLINVIK